MNYIIYMTIIIAAIFGGVGFKLVQNWYFKKYNYSVSVLKKYAGKNQAILLRAKKINDELVFFRNKHGLTTISFPDNRYVEVAFGGPQQWAISCRMDKEGILTGFDKIANVKEKLCVERLTAKQRADYRNETMVALEIKGNSNLRLILNQIVIPFILGLVIIGAILGMEDYNHKIAEVSSQYGSSVQGAANVIDEVNEITKLQADQLRRAGVTLHDVPINVSGRLVK